MQAEITYEAKLAQDIATLAKHSDPFYRGHLRDHQINVKGDWIQTYTGCQFWPTDPHPQDIDIEDIAHALSNMCRYNGHTKTFYSVAEHSVYVSQNVSEENQLAALLHDASEAYIADIARPVKPFLPEYLVIEERLMHAVADRFNFAWPMASEIKEVDYRILCDEKEQLMRRQDLPWILPPKGPLGVDIAGWTPGRAYDEFMTRYDEIVNP